MWRAALLNIDTIHTKDGCRLVLNGETLIEGVMEGTMYKLLIEAEPIKKATACIANTFGTETKKGATQSLEIWHHRLCHIHHAMVRRMASENMVHGLELTTDQQTFCEGCVLGKSKRHAFPTDPTCVRSTVAGQLIHTDVCGPMSVPTVGGCLYYVLFKDDFTRYTLTYCLKKKSKVLESLKKYSTVISRETGNRINAIRSDRGGEYTGKAMRDWLEEQHIEQQHTVPYTPEQNGTAERENRTIMEAVRSMLSTSNVHPKFWGEAVHTAVYTLNRCGTSTLPDLTPFEAWHGTRPSVSHLRIFGSTAYRHIPKELRKKLDPKAKKGIFMGYSLVSQAYRIWCNVDKKIYESRDVVFDEHSVLSAADSSTLSVDAET